MDILIKKLFFLAPFCFFLSFYSCGDNFLGERKRINDNRPIKEIISQDKYAHLVKKLLDAIEKSVNPTKYYKKLEGIFVSNKEINSSDDFLKELDKMPKISSGVSSYIENKYKDTKTKYDETGGENKKELNQYLKYSVASEIKGVFYNKDNKLDIEAGREKLTKEKSQDIVKKMELYDKINSKNIFGDIIKDPSKSNSEKIVDYMSR